MAEMVLAGPDGRPAIDASTGQQATMEELLRRRGLVSVNGNVSLANQMQQGQTTAQGQPQATAPAPSNPAFGANAPSAQEIAGAPSVAQVLSKNPRSAQPSVEQIEASGATEDDISGMEAAGLVAAGTAAAYAMYLLNKRRQAGMPSPDAGTGPSFNKGTTGGSNLPTVPPSNIVEGEWREVPEQPRITQTPRQLDAPTPQAAQEPPKQLGENTARALARNKMSAAATGATSGPAIPIAPDVATKVENPAAGLARTLGVPEATLQQLLKNKGLARTLGRVAR